ncbi:MAG: hypothetical protein FJ138_02490 [Deltaproteobacteria bacterium]|nr:hypothetical protein [Deltaproteobacteria bacterium]
MDPSDAPAHAPAQAHAQAPPSVAHAIAPPAFMLLTGDVERWWSRARAWYAPPPGGGALTDAHKRAQMRQLSRDLGRGCAGCHARGFEGYTDHGLIAAQMMAVSAEHGVGCAGCHVGARGLSALGARALLMWRYSYEEGRDCADCHPPGARFEALTPLGEESREAVERAMRRLGAALALPPPPPPPPSPLAP